MPSHLRRAGLILLLGALSVAPARAATVLVSAAAGPDGQALLLWDASQSFLGEPQYDSRLDQPVRFRRTAVPLADVFAELERQTGAQFAFWPKGDENPRVRVNLYLNEKAPPTLRDFMVQLGWAVDCAFAYAAGEDGPRYYLLGTTLARDILEQRDEDDAARWARYEREHRAEQRQRIATLSDKVDELQEALSLSREQAIAKYRGADDVMLLTLLDPKRRAAAQYACQEGLLGRDMDSERAWSELSAREQALLRTALDLDDRALAGKEVEIHVSGYDALGLNATVVTRDDNSVTETGIAQLRLLDLRDFPYGLERDEIVALGRLLGDPIVEEQEYVYIDAYNQARMKARAEREAQERALKSTSQLSQEMQERLAALPIKFEGKATRTLWEVQQAVAKASGLHVVSDCFWQPERALVATPNALLALGTSCVSEPERGNDTSGQALTYAKQWRIGWEWGEAGSFLRFRSLERGRWRAALLPPEVVAEVDACTEPYVQLQLAPPPPPPARPPSAEQWKGPIGPEGGRDPRRERRFPEGVMDLFRIAAKLNDTQLEWGGRLYYEDPSVPEQAWRQAFREAFLLPAMEGPGWVRLLVSLTKEQWQTLARGPLNVTQLDAEQTRLLLRTVGWRSPEPTPEVMSLYSLQTDGVLPFADQEAVRAKPDYRLFAIVLTSQPTTDGTEPSTVSGGWSVQPHFSLMHYPPVAPRPVPARGGSTGPPPSTAPTPPTSPPA